MTAPSWHGWSMGDRALYIAPEGEHMALHMQIDRQTQLVAIFPDEQSAMLVSDFLDASLGQTAAANAELLRRLENEQPLSFVNRPTANDDYIPPLDGLDDSAVTPL